MAKETIVQENGKVLTDTDDGNHRSYGILSEYYDNKSNRPLRLKKKLYEFYTAPITKFWANAVSFVSLFHSFNNLYFYFFLIFYYKTVFWSQLFVLTDSLCYVPASIFLHNPSKNDRTTLLAWILCNFLYNHNGLWKNSRNCYLGTSCSFS